jgi:general stress protein 26
MAEPVPELSREEGLKKVGELISEIQIAMLTTVGTDGALHSRPMATHKQEPFEGELYFLTPAHSGKVYEVENESEVNLLYVDPKHTYVSLTGRGSVENDRARIDQLWNPSYKAWFPNGKEDPEIRVLRVQVDGAEYWEAPHNAIVRNVKILARAVTGGKTAVGEHARVAL